MTTNNFTIFYWQCFIFCTKTFALWNFIWGIFSYDLIGNPITPSFFSFKLFYFRLTFDSHIVHNDVCQHRNGLHIKLPFICLFCSCIFQVNSLFNWLEGFLKYNVCCCSFHVFSYSCLVSHCVVFHCSNNFNEISIFLNVTPSLVSLKNDLCM